MWCTSDSSRKGKGKSNNNKKKCLAVLLRQSSPYISPAATIVWEPPPPPHKMKVIVSALTVQIERQACAQTRPYRCQKEVQTRGWYQSTARQSHDHYLTPLQASPTKWVGQTQASMWGQCDDGYLWAGFLCRFTFCPVCFVASVFLDYSALVLICQVL